MPPLSLRCLAVSLVLGCAFGAEAPPANPSAPAAPRGGLPGPTTPEELLKQVVAPPEFDVSVFATADQANYPVSVAAAPDGTVYVASDANGSLGTDLGRGRIVRLRDTDGDGRADEVKQFAKVDSPRGLVWDVDRLYVMHPPNVSAFIDRDGDGVADEEKILVRDIAFTFRDRPADHSSNGITLGIDGWLYLAIGDFGFMSAEGTDGRRLQLRGGGVVRVRPDGTGLELFARGTRNILEVALSPRLDGFARDNTNDGDGWDVKLHHFTGLENHGYPTLFRNFTSEAVAWLADYGAGSGCGAAWLDEPGIPEKWRGLITVDWGRERAYHHTLTPRGATFAATQEEFAKLPRATDLDVDAQSRLYVASWRGGQYTYLGPNVGFIARLTPKDYVAPAVPDFAHLNNAALIELFNSSSYRTRLAAQRTLLRRDAASATNALAALATDPKRSLETRILALFTLKEASGAASHPTLLQLAKDPAIAAWAIRALADRENQRTEVPDDVLVRGMESDDARTQREAAVAAARLGRAHRDLTRELGQLLGDPDAVVAHTAVQALVRLQDTNEALAIVASPNESAEHRTGALRVLQAQHTEAVVDALLAQLAVEKADWRREGLIRALCRLYYVEGKWTGDSWGTRPDARGPYYQPERWSATPKINAALKELLDHAEGEAAAKLNEIFALHRVSPGDTTARLIALAETDDTLLATLAQQLSGADNVPATAVPLLKRAIAYVPPAPSPPPAGTQPQRGRGPRAPDTGPTQIRAMQALVKAGTPEAMEIVLAALPTLQNRGRLGDGVRDKSANALFTSAALENHYRFFAQEAAKAGSESAVWADAALLHLAARKFGASEARSFAAEQLDAGWRTPARRAQIIRAAALGREASRGNAIVAALDDSDADVAAAAKSAVATLKLDGDAIRAERAQPTPLVGTLSAADAMAQVLVTHGSVARGEQLFNQAGCVACHTTKASEPLKGPFLGAVAKMFDRRALAEAILDPNKSLAQGFVTNQFTLKDGTAKMGFVTREGADVVAIRDIGGQQSEIRLADVAKREHLTISLMPPGLMSGYSVRDFAALLDYLQSLAAEGN